MPRWSRIAGGASLIAAALYGCQGEIGSGPIVPDPNAEGAVISGARRLTRAEYDATLLDLLGDTSNSGRLYLPPDATDPFDNDYHSQRVSPALIEAAEAIAGDAAERAITNTAMRDSIVPCAPTGAGDDACLRQFITTWGRRALRRPVRPEEVDHYVTSFKPFAEEGNDFYIGVSLVIRAILQDVEFLYRLELGEPVEGLTDVVKLTDHEVATRLSYYLLGTTPPVDLLDIADAGGLSTANDVGAVAASLIERDLAKERVDRFHALWLSYHQLPHSAELTAALREESRRLVERVVFENGGTDYFELFRSEQTYLTTFLSGHYSYSATTDGWFDYPDERRGLLSHGSVLSAGAKFNDTSPTQRGKFVRMRLLCEPEPKPPPDVNVDEPPAATGPNACKLDAYKAHSGTCGSCHAALDGIGFGLERYSTSGQFRTEEAGKPECPIDGQGDIPGLGQFNGPAGLAQLLMDSGRLEECIVRQTYRFAHGRREKSTDGTPLNEIATKFKEHVSFKQMLLDVASSPSFGYRRIEEAP